ncbi:MAG: TonB-dependent receptor [Alistipes sp.]
MKRTQPQPALLLFLLLLLWGAQSLSAHPVATNDGTPVQFDTIIMVDKVQVTAIKQGLVLRNQPITASIIGSQSIAHQHINALKDISKLVPNFYIPDYGSRMTSSIYVRGLGARIDQPVMGLNVDNVPIFNKDNYDFDLVDIEHIEVLRGPQSTLYGRNTMGGVINVYTLSPLTYEGVRLGVEYGSGNTLKFRASSYYKVRPNFGVAVAGHYTRTDGFFDNLATGKKCDWENFGGGHIKTQWRGRSGLRIDNTLSFSSLKQGGYPYAFVETGEINYNDTCSYRRTTVSNGLTIRYEAAKFSVSSITGYQYSDDEMILDQDFLPASYFTLKQARKEHTLTEDLVFKSHTQSAYQWLFGAFGFYRHGTMNAPVTFKQDGINDLILKHVNGVNPDYITRWDSDQFVLESRFRNPSVGAALYHESNYTVGGWRFTAGIRLDYEYARLNYHNATDTGCTRYKKQADGSLVSDVYKDIHIDNNSALTHSFVEVLPKVAVLYRFRGGNTLYASISKGYKAGGFNTQMFSDVLQQQIMKDYFAVGKQYNIKDIVTYKPEQSWNYEIGSRLSNATGTLHADLALFYIDCRNQQLTVFPDGTTTGRMMTNAGQTRSFGGELSLQASPVKNLDFSLTYGYTNAKFVKYNNGKTDFKGNYIPYAPQNTASATLEYTIPIHLTWLNHIVLRAGISGIGKIYWNEENSLTQPFYTLTEASIRFEHKNYSVDLWGRNLGNTAYDTFHFVSIGNSFVQRGRPRIFGITLNVNI